jgi:riboflavin biosynthesis RibT protein
MFIRYKKHYRKIAMGLLSFMPNEKGLQKLQTTISEYETKQQRQLLLWKEEEGIIGLMGVWVGEDQIVVQHISVNPSHRNQGIGKRMVKSLKKLYPHLPIVPNENTSPFIAKYDFEESLMKENKSSAAI